jgi:hypothetical protein
MLSAKKTFKETPTTSISILSWREGEPLRVCPIPGAEVKKSK